MNVKSIAGALAIALVSMLAAGAAAQQTNTSERTFLTFSQAVEMPGLTLQPGTYVFKLADTPSRNVVQVWDEDEEHMLGHWLFVQAERPEVTHETVVMFREESEGATPAVQFWYFPGERIGKEFIYPEDQARRIAARTGQVVRTEDGIIDEAVEETADVAEDVGDVAEGAVDVTEDVAEPAIDVAEDIGEGAVDVAEDVGEGVVDVAEDIGDVGEDIGQAALGLGDDDVDVDIDVDAPEVEARGQVEIEEFDEPRPVGTTGELPSELPQTASPFALAGLLGLLSLAGAAGIRAVRR